MVALASDWLRHFISSATAVPVYEKLYMKHALVSSDLFADGFQVSNTGPLGPLVWSIFSEKM